MTQLNIDLQSSNEDLISRVINSIDNSYIDFKKSSFQRGISCSPFDVIDYIPFVSNVSGVVRAIFGGMETLAGIPLFPIQLVNRVVFKKPEQGYPSFYLNKGISNVVRGVFAQGTIVANIGLYVYDHSYSFKYDIQNMFGIRN